MGANAEMRAFKIAIEKDIFLPVELDKYDDFEKRKFG